MAVNKYWEKEKPVVKQFGVNEFRFYPVARKLQVFPILANTPNGVGRGATIDLESMQPNDLQGFGELIALVTGEQAVV